MLNFAGTRADAFRLTTEGVIVAAMTRLLEEAVATVSALPDHVQDEVAYMLLQFAGIATPIYRLTPEEHADLAEAEAEAARGEFATDEDVRAMWAKYGR